MKFTSMNKQDLVLLNEAIERASIASAAASSHFQVLYEDAKMSKDMRVVQKLLCLLRDCCTNEIRHKKLEAYFETEQNCN